MSLESSPDYDRIVEIIRNAFNFFDTENKGCIDLTNTATAVRYLGLVPTESDIEQFCSEVEEKDESGDYVYFDKFLPAIIRRLEEKKFFPSSYDELVRAFRYFDEEGKGFLTREQLETYMTENGEALDEDEMNEMILTAIDKEKGVIDYSDYATWMIENDEIGIELRGYLEKHFQRLEIEAAVEKALELEKVDAGEAKPVGSNISKPR